MSAAVMNEIKEKYGLLTPAEKAELAGYFARQGTDGEIELDEWDLQIAEDIRNGNSANVDRAIARAEAEGTLLPWPQRPANL
jgi:hypothetical protein